MPKPAKSRKARAPLRARRPKSKTKPKRPPINTKRASSRGFNAVRMGQRLGNIVGRPYGRLGAEAGRLFRSITGFGDYKVTRNSLVPGADSLPTFSNTVAGTRVTHREFLFDVITSPIPGQFTIETIPIQPALLGSFPWLSASAENYQEYRLNGCVYEFKSNSYDALSSTNTASGTVVMTTNYNVLDPVFTNKFTMEQSQFTSSSKPSVNLLHPIECNKLETPTSVLYTRSAQSFNGDNRLYDWGNFNIATVGMQGSATNIGELWVTYDITLLKPKLSATSDVADHYVALSSSIALIAPGGPNYFGTITAPMVLTSDSDMGTSLSSTNGLTITAIDTITWPSGYQGNVAVIVRYALSSVPALTLATQFGYAISNSVKFLNLLGWGDPNGRTMDNEAVSAVPPLVYNGNGGCTLVAFFTINNGGTLRLTGGTNGTRLVCADIIITALPISLGTGIVPIDPALLVNYTPLVPLDIKEHKKVVVGFEDLDSDVEYIHSYTSAPSPIPSIAPRSSSNKSTKLVRL